MAKKVGTIQVKVRMSREFHRELTREAGRNGRTLNAEILARLGATHKSNALPEKANEPLLRAFEEAQKRTEAVVKRYFQEQFRQLLEERKVEEGKGNE